MKKLFIIIVLFLILICNIQPKADFSLLDYFDGEYTVYSNSGEGVNLGFCYMSSKPVDNKMGESLKIENCLPSAALTKLNAKVVKTEYLQTGASVIYAYTNKIANSVEVNNNKVNLQLACYDDYFIIGWPLIMGSF